jgi:hypothetical protein
VPLNSRTGGGTGVLLQLHFFLDDLFPKSLGKPLIGPPDQQESSASPGGSSRHELPRWEDAPT